jgi:glutamate dehydrogenase
MERHRLRREIVATVLTNNFLNRMRPASYWLMTEESGKPASDVARAFTIIRDSFDLRTIWSDIDGLDNKLPARVQTEMMVEVMRLVERAVKWLLRSGYETLDIAGLVAEMKPCIAQLWERLHDVLPAPVLALVKASQGELEADGLPERLAYRVASLGVMAAALDIVRLARGRRVEDVARVYFGVGTRFGLERLRNAGANIAAETPWQKAAVAAVIDDLYQYQSTLASKVISETNGARDPVESWLAPRLRVVERVDQLMNDVRAAQSVDLAMLTVASRQLRVLVES